MTDALDPNNIQWDAAAPSGGPMDQPYAGPQTGTLRPTPDQVSDHPVSDEISQGFSPTAMAEGAVPFLHTQATAAHPTSALLGAAMSAPFLGGALAMGGKALDALFTASREASAAGQATPLQNALVSVEPAVKVMGKMVVPQRGQFVRNLARAAGTGATVSGVDSAAAGDSASQTASNMAVGAVVGPIASAATGALAPSGQRMVAGALDSAAGRVVGAAGRTGPWMALAKKLDESPTDIQQAADTLLKTRGYAPNMAEFMGMKSQGVIKDLAKVNPIIADAAEVAGSRGHGTLADQLAATAFDTFPQTEKAMRDLATAQFQAGLQPIKDVAVPLSKDEVAFLSSRDVGGELPRASIGQPPLARDRLDQAQMYHAYNPNGYAQHLTVNDLDEMRQNAADTMVMAARRGAGLKPTSSEIQKSAQNAQRVEDLAARASGYRDALNSLRESNRYISGFTEGRGGAEATNTIMADPATANGFEHGAALKKAQDALDNIATGAVVDHPADATPSQAAQGVAAIGAGPNIWGLVHAARLLPGKSPMGEASQKTLAAGLFSRDPAGRAAGAAALQRAKGSAVTTHRAQAGAGAVAAAQSTEYMRSGQQQ